jgi:hypothetical protein
VEEGGRKERRREREGEREAVTVASNKVCESGLVAVIVGDLHVDQRVVHQHDLSTGHAQLVLDVVEMPIFPAQTRDGSRYDLDLLHHTVDAARLLCEGHPQHTVDHVPRRHRLPGDRHILEIQRSNR